MVRWYRSLFLRIFLWFWLAMTLVGATLVLTTELTQPEVRLPRWREFTGDTISYFAERSADIFEQGGREALDEYLDRNTVSPTNASIPITMPEKVRDKLHNLEEHGYGSIDQLVCEAVNKYSIIKLSEEKEYQFLSNEVNTIANSRKVVFSDYGSD